MINRKFLNLVFSVVAIAALLLSGGSQAFAQTPPPPTGSGTTHTHQGMIMPADREAAAQRAKADRLAAAKKNGRPTSASASAAGLNPGGTPDYFGTTPNYANSPQALVDISVNITDSTGVGASALATVAGLTGLTLTSPGAGYTSAPAVEIRGGGGFGATATAAVSGGQVVSLTLTNPGAGYTFAPDIVFSGGGASTPAAATASVAPGSVTGITVTSGGSGYSASPTVAITGSGSGACAAASVSPAGVITAIQVTCPGNGYGLKVDGTGKIIGIRKFVDTLPGLGQANANDLGQYIPVAVPDTTSFTNPPSDYYEIALVQYTEQLHKDLPPTTLRGYVQLETAVNASSSQHFALTYTDGTPIKDAQGSPVYGYDKPHYMGPMILTQRDRPVRIKFTNFLPSGSGGDLFIPVDSTVMGAGSGPQGVVTGITITNGGSGYTSAPTVTISGGGGTGATASATVLNGVVNGIAITNEGANYTSAPTIKISGGGGSGASAIAKASGAAGGSYTQNRATLHLHGGNTPWISDGTPHQWTTPAGENALYPQGVSVYNVPDMPDPGPGSLTFYYTNQQSARLMFYHDHSYGLTRLNVYAGEAAGYLVSDPIEQVLINGGTIPGSSVTVPAGTIPADQIPLIIQDKTFVDAGTIAAQDPTWKWGSHPGTPTTGDLWFPHVYMPNQNPYDMEGVNAMGRWDYGPWFWPPYTGLMNGPVPNPLAGTTPEEGPVNPGTPNPSIVPEGFMDTPLVNGTAYPALTVQPKAYRLRILNASNDRSLNLQLYQAKSSSPMWSADGKLLDPGAGEVNMVPAVTNAGLPANWPTDGRDGGVPDPKAVGPSFIEIGTEGGLLPAPAVIDNVPVGYDYNRRSITVLNVMNHALMLGPAERADVIVDFSQFAGKTIILYNDAPAPVPAFDPRNDYYTGDPDNTPTGGAPTTLPGYGPNIRTIMQITVAAAAPAPAYDLTALNAALPAAFAASQPAPIVPQPVYDAAYNAKFPGDTSAYVRIQDTQFTFKPIGGSSPITLDLQPKAIQELFTTDYGRMNATLGVEMPNTSITTQTTIPYGYVDPPTEIIQNVNPAVTPIVTLGDGTQIWKITHNGVDTHAIHWHMFNVQLINRVGWDGMVKPPEPNEVGWKETVRMNPLEDAIVAVRPIIPSLPFKLPNSLRPLDVTMKLGSTMAFTNVTPTNGGSNVANATVNFGWEYVWHCHLLGHEENDMMRPIIIAVAPETPSNLVGAMLNGPRRVRLTWTNNALNATGFTIQRASDTAFTTNLVSYTTGPTITTYTDSTVQANTNYYYRVLATNLVGSQIAGYPNATAVSDPSNVVAFAPPTAPTGVTAALSTVNTTTNIVLTWTNTSSSATGITVQRAVVVNGVPGSWSTLTTTLSGTAVTYTDTKTKAATTYVYRIQAANSFGSSPWAVSNNVTRP